MIMQNFEAKIKKPFVAVILSLFAGLILGLVFIFIFSKIFKPKYAVFFLEDGSVYFGEVGFVNRFVIKNPIFLRQNQDGSLNVVYYSDLFYLPQNKLHLNSQKVLAWSYLQDNSPLVSYIQRKISLPQTPQQPPSPPSLRENISTSSELNSSISTSTR